MGALSAMGILIVGMILLIFTLFTFIIWKIFLIIPDIGDIEVKPIEIKKEEFSSDILGSASPVSKERFVMGGTVAGRTMQPCCPRGFSGKPFNFEYSSDAERGVC